MQINYFMVFKEGWRDVKSGSLQSFGEIWGIWLKGLDFPQDSGLLGCSMEWWLMVLAVSPSGWSVCSHWADVKCKSHCSVGAEVGLHTLWVTWTREKASTSRIQSHSTADTAMNRTVLKTCESHPQRALQGVGLLSSHTESPLPSFSLSSLTALFSLL